MDASVVPFAIGLRPSRSCRSSATARPARKLWISLLDERRGASRQSHRRGGRLRSYVDHSGASGQPFHRHYCGSCGSHVYSHGAAYGAVAFIKAGTLDDATWLAPSTHIWVAEKLPWVSIPEGTTQFSGNPS